MPVLTLSRNRLIVRGLESAGLIAGILLALAALAGYCLHSFLLSIWIGAILSGPIPPLLTHFDITNAQLNILWLAIPFLYWFALGVGAGLIGWKVSAAESQPERWVEQGLRITRAAAAMLVFAGGLLSFFLYPNFVGGGSSPENMIKNNLRIIEGSKDQLALEKNLPTGYVVTEADLAQYIKGGTVRHLGTERYILNPIGVPCYPCWRLIGESGEKGGTRGTRCRKDESFDNRKEISNLALECFSGSHRRGGLCHQLIFLPGLIRF